MLWAYGEQKHGPVPLKWFNLQLFASYKEYISKMEVTPTLFGMKKKYIMDPESHFWAIVG